MDKYEQLFEDYFEERELAENTRKQYLLGLKKFRKRFGKDFSKQNMMIWKNELKKEYAPKTVNIRLQPMNLFMDLINQPRNKVKLLKIQQPTSVENVITRQEYDYLCQKLVEDKNQKMFWRIQFIAKTGARVSEVIRFTKSDLKNGEAVMWSKGKMRTIFIPEQLIKESVDYFKHVDSEWLFPSPSNPQNHITSRGIASSLHYLANKYGIREEAMHPHSFRHFFAVSMMNKTKDISLVSDLLGHASLATTQIYTRISKKEQQSHMNNAIDW